MATTFGTLFVASLLPVLKIVLLGGIGGICARKGKPAHAEDGACWWRRMVSPGHQPDERAALGSPHPGAGLLTYEGRKVVSSLAYLVRRAVQAWGARHAACGERMHPLRPRVHTHDACKGRAPPSYACMHGCCGDGQCSPWHWPLRAQCGQAHVPCMGLGLRPLDFVLAAWDRLLLGCMGPGHGGTWGTVTYQGLAYAPQVFIPALNFVVRGVGWLGSGV